MDVRPAASHPGGNVVVLVGVVGFMMSCSLPHVGASFLSIIGLGRARARTPYALVAGVAAWTLTWVGVLLSQWAFGQHEIGYRTLYASVGVVIMGAIVVSVSSRHRERDPAPIPA